MNSVAELRVSAARPEYEDLAGPGQLIEPDGDHEVAQDGRHVLEPPDVVHGRPAQKIDRE